MLAAEKWYEYQTNYKKYGLEMRPAEAKPRESSRRTKSVLNTKDKARLMLLTVFAGFLCICLIITAAYSAQVKYNINGLLAQADAVQGEIENLNVAIKSAVSITVIEEKAINQLGMVYPSVDQILYLDSDSNNIKDFDQTLKEIAYNK